MSYKRQHTYMHACMRLCAVDISKIHLWLAVLDYFHGFEIVKSDGKKHIFVLLLDSKDKKRKRLKKHFHIIEKKKIKNRNKNSKIGKKLEIEYFYSKIS